MCIDLHTHSLYSDGCCSPAELLRMAAESGLAAIALTDHDTVEGVGGFLSHKLSGSVRAISGLEISAMHRDISLHILGYGIDHTHGELLDWLAKLQAGRVRRNEKILGKLNRMGIAIDAGELKAISGPGQTGRPHIAKLLHSMGIVKSPADAFTLYLRKGGAAWAGRFAYSAAESIDMIHRAGGIAVLAHPGILQQQVPAMPLLVAELVERGLDGLEAMYPSHTPEMEKKLKSLARKYDLVLTGGSDYHGNERAFPSLAGKKSGFCPPVSLLTKLEERLHSAPQR